MNFKEKITKEEIASLERKAVFEGKIHLISKKKDIAPAVKILSQHKVLGFDTETKPIFFKGKDNNGVALIQFATEDEAFLFRTNHYGIPKELQELIASPTILKIGISLKDDYREMKKAAEIDPQGFVDLQKLMRAYGIKEIGLQKIYAILFQERISKSQRMTNWEAKTLDEKQQQYAALDAYACLRIYNLLAQEPLPSFYRFGLV